MGGRGDLLLLFLLLHSVSGSAAAQHLLLAQLPRRLGAVHGEGGGALRRRPAALRLLVLRRPGVLGAGVVAAAAHPARARVTRGLAGAEGARQAARRTAAGIREVAQSHSSPLSLEFGNFFEPQAQSTNKAINCYDDTVH